MRKLLRGIPVLIALALSGGAAQIAAQSTEGRVIAAGSGRGVAGAEVLIDGPVTRLLFTDADGRWRAEGFTVGEYAISIRHVGYAAYERTVAIGSAVIPLEVTLTPRPILLDELVVTAGRRSMRLGDSPVPTEIVGRSEILETGAPDLAGVLTERVGLTLQGGHPTGSGIMIQGMGSERVLILMDGQPFIGRISGQVDLSRIPTSMIERIEIVKGPQSTLYGSEAMGGVINVITRTPSSIWGGDLHLAAGAQGRLELGVGGTGSLGPIRGVAEVGRRSLDRVSGVSDGAGQLMERWDGRVGAEWSDPVRGLRAEVGGIVLDERQRWASGPLFNFADNLQWTGRFTLGVDRGADRLTATGYLTAFDHLSRRSTAPRPVAGSGEKETQRLQSLDLLYNRILGSHALDLGIDGERESISSDRVVGASRDSQTIEAFGQATLSFGRVTLLPGVRSSWSDLWGTHLTPRVALMVRPSPSWSLRLSAGEGFRAPDFKETHLEFLNVGPGFAYTVRGNPDLGPELSRNLTGSVEWAGDRAYLKLQGFHNDFDGFIETVAVGDSSGVEVYTYGNIDDGFTRGVEVEVGVTHGGWRLELGRSWLRAEREDTGEVILGHPGSSSRALLSFAHPFGTRVSVTGTHTGKTGMSRTEAGMEWRDDFVRFDLRIAQSIPGGFEVAFGADNLFQAREERWPGFTERHLYTAVSWLPFGGI